VTKRQENRAWFMDLLPPARSPSSCRFVELKIKTLLNAAPSRPPTQAPSGTVLAGFAAYAAFIAVTVRPGQARVGAGFSRKVDDGT